MFRPPHQHPQSQVQQSSPAPAPAEPSAAVLEEIAKLREALAASQSARNAEIQEAVSDLREAFQVQTDALEDSIAAKDTEIENAQRQNEARLAGLQAMLDAERAQREGLEAEMARDGLIADQRLLEERRRQEEEQRQREAEQAAQELLTAQIVSPSVVYADGLRATSAGGANPTAAVAGADGPPLSEKHPKWLSQSERFRKALSSKPPCKQRSTATCRAQLWRLCLNRWPRFLAIRS